MKYVGMPLGMWILYKQSFRDHLVSVFGYSAQGAKEISASAKQRYRAIIQKIGSKKAQARLRLSPVLPLCPCRLRQSRADIQL